MVKFKKNLLVCCRYYIQDIYVYLQFISVDMQVINVNMRQNVITWNLFRRQKTYSC